MKKTSTILTISSLLSFGFSTLAFSSSASQFTAQGNSVNSAPELAIDFCVKSATWTRPSESEQINFLRSWPLSPRYERFSDAQILNRHEWTDDFLVYIEYYGASGSGEMVRSSGIWSLKDPKAFTDGVRGYGDCNSDFVTQPLIQMWVFSHDVRKVQWIGDRYLVTVKPTGQGFQIFQFPRQEDELPRRVNPRELPAVEIIDETGSTISLCRADFEKSRMVCR